MRRRFLIEKHGSVFPVQHKFLPIYDLKTPDVLAMIRDAGVKLPTDYKFLSRTFEGLRYAQLGPLSKVYPEDVKKILEWFPLAKAELLRRQFYAEEGLEATARSAKSKAQETTQQTIRVKANKKRKATS